MLPLSSNQEKPLHYTYLKEFRVHQCPLFLQHKCTNHKPYTCFDWHFPNQRRRRPFRRRDGTFNYTPDTYCTKYDESSGICPDKDECPYLHKTAGDTERRYHLRYYKTAKCVYETDPRGYCTKNGKHCAFAHGPQDLRNPVYDIRELQSMENGNSSGELSDPSGLLSTSSGTIERERNAVLEDPRWNETAFVLANYKTELCKRPPRYCRQGYACPQYHNGKDRRRSPKIFKYRSTPCPNTKQGDEWVDPSKCEQGDQCPYCHSRTEQQFHPEIFKSTKCKDIQDTGYCPRGAFCAFAHNDEEIVATRDIDLENIDICNTSKHGRDSPKTWLGVSFAEQNNLELPSSLLTSGAASTNTTKNTLGPIARPRSYSHSQAKSTDANFNQLHAALARARLIDELKMQSYNVATNSNSIGFRERAVHSFSIPSATDATQLLFKNSPITALDFLPSSRLSKIELSEPGGLLTSSSGTIERERNTVLEEQPRWNETRPVMDSFNLERERNAVLEEQPPPARWTETSAPPPITENFNVERERNAVLEDPRWNETAFVLVNYKTELCKRPPRYCRQGYACPQYHNGKDRRRSPKIFKYRSTPCPNTKQGDEWVDPGKCEYGDLCPYCHSRTEQQFHPEIFKSTKCKDIQDTGYCPRGAFCAFAHNDEEIVATRDIDLEIVDTDTTSRPVREMLDTWSNLIL